MGLCSWLTHWADSDDSDAGRKWAVKNSRHPGHYETFEAQCSGDCKDTSKNCKRQLIFSCTSYYQVGDHTFGVPLSISEVAFDTFGNTALTH